MSINWQFYFSGKDKRNRNMYFFGFVNNQRVEKHVYKGGVRFLIRDIGKLPTYCKTEDELIKKVNSRLLRQQKQVEKQVSDLK